MTRVLSGDRPACRRALTKHEPNVPSGDWSCGSRLTQHAHVRACVWRRRIISAVFAVFCVRLYTDNHTRMVCETIFRLCAVASGSAYELRRCGL